MKKILTLLTVALSTLCVQAETRVVWNDTPVETGNYAKNIELSWENKGDILPTAMMNDILRVTYNYSAGEYPHVTIGNPNNSWNVFSALSEADVTTTGDDQTFDYVIADAASLSDIRSSGIIVRGKNITITKVELVEAADRYDAISITIGADGIATFSSSKHHSFAAAGITPYYASAAADGNVTLTPIADKTTWGYQGYILKGAEGTYTIPVVTSNDDATYPSGTNYLKGTDDYSRNLTASTASECRYIFAKNGSTIGFYYLNSSYTLAAHRAYLQTDSDIRSSSVRAVEMRFLDAMGGTTAIQTLRSAADSSTEDCYTLSGLRVAKPTKGIYVVNGKKIIVK